MAVNFGYAGAYSGFIPSFEASGQLIDCTRDPKTFQINKYAQYVPSEEPIGVYAVLDADQPARVVTPDDSSWPNGAERPPWNDNHMPFVFLDYRTKRHDIGFTLGQQTIDNTKWKILAAYAGMAQQQTMTERILEAYLVLNGQVQNGQPALGAAVNPALVWGSNTGTPGSLVPGLTGWYSASDDESSPNFLAIKRTLMAAFRRINLLTNGKVQRGDLRLVLGPDDAIAIANTSEIQNFLKNNQFALDQVKGIKEGQNMLWGLPDYYMGFQLCVDDTVRVASRPNIGSATTTTGMSLAPLDAGDRSYIWQPGSAGILSRPGGLEGNYGVPSYSTLQIYFYEEMNVETLSEPHNRRTIGAVVEDRATVISAPAAGFWLTGINR